MWLKSNNFVANSVRTHHWCEATNNVWSKSHRFLPNSVRTQFNVFTTKMKNQNDNFNQTIQYIQNQNLTKMQELKRRLVVRTFSGGELKTRHVQSFLRLFLFFRCVLLCWCLHAGLSLHLPCFMRKIKHLSLLYNHDKLQ